MASCTSKQEAMLSSEEEARTDSLTLRIAVMPVMDCLPIYYAQRTGLMKEMNLNAHIETYMAQMDIDTTLQKGHADVGYSDLIRAIRLMPTVNNLHAFMAGQERLTLISQKGKRVKKENQLKERMIAMCRLSVILSSPGMKPASTVRSRRRVPERKNPFNSGFLTVYTVF